jgi:hypothetical protein
MIMYLISLKYFRSNTDLSASSSTTFLNGIEKAANSTAFAEGVITRSQRKNSGNQIEENEDIAAHIRPYVIKTQVRGFI